MEHCTREPLARRPRATTCALVQLHNLGYDRHVINRDRSYSPLKPGITRSTSTRKEPSQGCESIYSTAMPVSTKADAWQWFLARKTAALLTVNYPVYGRGETIARFT